MKHTVVLDLDGSIGALPNRRVVPLGQWQEALRFGCSLGMLRRFRPALKAALADPYATVMLGSGDFHHLSWPLIERVSSRKPFQVVVLDNHPDNMRFPFGVHCGSWVRQVALMPEVSHVHVVGICSRDIGCRHAWENYLTPLRRGKLSYWSAGVNVGWARAAGVSHAFHAFDTVGSMTDAFCERQRAWPRPTYMSIDKDVFTPNVARTNWDQGQMQLAHAAAIIRTHRDNLLGSDITGEISAYRYRSWLKRKLSAIDDQPSVDEAALQEWQQQQHRLNLVLLSMLHPTCMND